MKKTLLSIVALFIAMIIINSCTKENLDNQEFKTLDMNTISENFEDFQTTLLSGDPIIIKAGNDQIKVTDLSIDPYTTYEGMTYLTSPYKNGSTVAVLIMKKDKAIFALTTYDNSRKEISGFSNIGNLNDFTKDKKLFSHTSKDVIGYDFNIQKYTVSSTIDFSQISNTDKVKVGISAPKEIKGNCEHNHQDENNVNIQNIETDFVSKTSNTVNRTWNVKHYCDNANNFFTVWNFTEYFNYSQSIASLNLSFTPAMIQNVPWWPIPMVGLRPYVYTNHSFTRLAINLNNPQSGNATLIAFRNELERINAPTNNTVHIFKENDSWPGIAGLAWIGKGNDTFQRRVGIVTTRWSEGAMAHEIGHTLGCTHNNGTTFQNGPQNGLMIAGWLGNAVPYYLNNGTANIARNTLGSGN